MPRLVDPLSRSIDFSDGVWFGHIIKGHPEMRGLRVEAQAAITGPSVICLSNSDPDCRLYYLNQAGSPLLVCVVADVVAGFVKTAYLAKRVKPGGQEWP